MPGQGLVVWARELAERELAPEPALVLGRELAPVPVQEQEPEPAWVRVRE